MLLRSVGGEATRLVRTAAATDQTEKKSAAPRSKARARFGAPLGSASRAEVVKEDEPAPPQMQIQISMRSRPNATSNGGGQVPYPDSIEDSK